MREDKQTLGGAVSNEEVCSIHMPIKLMHTNRSRKSTESRDEGDEEVIASASFFSFYSDYVLHLNCGLFSVMLLIIVHIANT